RGEKTRVGARVSPRPRPPIRRSFWRRDAMSANPPSARGIALQGLLDCRTRHAFAQELLDEHLGRASLTSSDRRLVTQLVYGVLRWRGTLTELASRATSTCRAQH